MGDDHHGHAFVGQLAHDLEDVADQFRVEGAGGFVEQHHIRVHGEGAGDGDTLLLAAGELGREGVFPVGKADLGQIPACHLDGLCLAALLGPLLGEGEIAQDIQVWKQVELLEDNTDAGADIVQIRFRISDVHAFDDDGAAGGLLEPVYAAQQGGLT